MKILYRPQRGSLAEAMAEVKEFNSLDELFDYLVNHTVELYGKPAFDKDEIYISDYGYDERIDWQTYIVTVGRYLDNDYLEDYHCPQAIGFMTFKE